MRWERQGNLSSHWTIGLNSRSFPLALLGLAVLQLVLANILPPTEDELYYWAWSKVLSPSYYDHPPMVAYLIYLSTKIFGDTLLGVRFFGVVISFCILFTLGLISEGRSLLTFLLFTPLFIFGGLLMTPDLPFLFFWTLYLFWLTRINRAFSEWSDDPIARVYRSSPIPYFRWILGGVILGLGILSKYTMLLALPCTLLVLISRYRFKAWSKGFIVHCGVALLFILPILLFNYQNSFAPFKYQWAHAMAGGEPGHFWEFIAGQVLLLGALPFLMLPWLLVQYAEIRGNFRLHVCLVFFLAPLAFILVQAVRSKLEANWGVMCYISFWPLAQSLFTHTSFKPQAKGLAIISFLPPIVVTTLLMVHVFRPIEYLSPEKDRLAKFQALNQLSKTIAHDLRDNDRTEIPLLAPNYQWVSYLRFQNLKVDQLPGDTKPSHFTVSPLNACEKKSVIYLADFKELPSSLNCFTDRTLLREYPLIIRKKEMARFYLYELGR